MFITQRTLFCSFLAQVSLLHFLFFCSLGLNHDGDNGCRDGINIMASVLIGGEEALKWSSCSRDAIQKFLRLVTAKTLN